MSEEEDDNYNLCDDMHEEIAFYGNKCPLCEKIAELEKAKEWMRGIMVKGVRNEQDENLV